MRLLVSLECQGVELAPSMIWDEPTKASAKERLELRHKIDNSGLKLTGFQSLLYTHPELLLFKDEKTRKKILDYFVRLMDLCVDLGGEVLVFGSPRNRNIGEFPPRLAYGIANDFFQKVGEKALERNLFFCIEPLGKTETNFINTVSEAETLIFNCKGIGLHIDVKGLIDADEVSAPYLIRSFAWAKHVHINDPNLEPPGSSGFDHKKIRDKMEGSGYSRFISIEMRRHKTNIEGTICKAVNYVKQIYLK